MSPDRVKQLAIVLVVMVGLWGVASVVRGGNDQRSGDGFDLPQFSRADLIGIDIVGSAEAVSLRQRDGAWTVNGFEATPGLVDGLLESLSDDSLTGELISISASSHERLGVTVATGKSVTLVGPSGDIGTFLVGNNGPGFGTVYVRFPDSDDTYLLRSDLGNHTSRTIENWREHEILALDPASIGRMEVRRNRESYTLVRVDSAWAFSDGEAADSAAAGRMANQYRTVRATGFASDSDVVNLDRPDIVVDLKGPTGTLLARLEMDSTEAGVWLRSSTDSVVFKVADWSLGQLVPPDSLLHPRNPS